MEQKSASRLFLSENAIIAYFFVIKILFHLFHPEYGYLRDELYYLAVSENFNSENLDFLPLTPLYLKLITFFFGTGLKAVHFASALCGAISLVLACLITRHLGGRRYAIILTGIFVLFSGFLIFGALFTYDSLDFLLQTLAIYLLVRIIKTDQQRLWILVGITLGLGVLNKMSILLFAASLFLALLLSRQRNYLRKIWPWLGGLIGIIFAFPFVYWQSAHDWYFLDFVAYYSGGVAYVASFPEFLWGQILPNNIFGFPVWVTGAGLLLFSKRWQKYRLFGLMYIIFLALAFILGVKFYFLIPMYTILYATGAIYLADILANGQVVTGMKKRLRQALPFVYILLSLPLLPMLVPILPIESFVRYASVLGVHAGIQHENQPLGQLPFHVADRFGWPQLAEQFTAIYDSVSATDNVRPGIITGNYGQSSAIYFFDKSHGLPFPVDMYSWYYFEALRKHEVKESYLSIGLPADMLGSIFGDVVYCGTFSHKYSVPVEQNQPIFYCRRAKYDLKSVLQVARKIDARFMEILENDGAEAARVFYEDFSRKNPQSLLFSERMMNTLGYDYLYAGHVEEAIILFRLNVIAYPEAWNVYDSLGEAYMVGGQYEDAVKNYQRSLELNPANENGRKKLAELAGLTQSQNLN